MVHSNLDKLGKGITGTVYKGMGMMQGNHRNSIRKIHRTKIPKTFGLREGSKQPVNQKTKARSHRITAWKRVVQGDS
jgi:hypothetical protein